MKASIPSEARGPRRLLTSARYSLRLRLLALVFLVVLGSILLTALFALKQAEKMSVVQLEHEALLLSDALEAAIKPCLAGEPDIEDLQAQIDRLSESRDRNDIEINVMLRRGYRSSIAASNIPDNIERTSVYEHRDMMAALEKGEPVVFIGRDDDTTNTTPIAPGSPDLYLPPGERFVSITTPIFIDGEGVGSINTKLSLMQVDREISRIRAGIWLMGFVFLAGAFLLVFAAVQRGLRPLNRLADEVAQVDCASLGHRFLRDARPAELRSVIARLNELLDRLEAAFKREKQFTANVAHELRTPIATLKTICEVGLQEISAAGEKQQSAPIFRDALSVSNQMARLVDSLLALVRCESGLQQIDLSPVDINECIQGIWKDYETEARQKKIEAEFDLADSACSNLDHSLFEAILRNLFSNAATYTPEAGRICCELKDAGDRWVLSLSNTNNGLTMRDIEKLFQPFWRKDESRSDSSHSGLGLSLVASYAGLLNIGFEADLPSQDQFQIRLHIPSVGSM